MFGSTFHALSAHGSSSTTYGSVPEADTFKLTEEYGAEAAASLAKILGKLVHHGYFKAQIGTDWSAFDRILGGICWLLQRIVKREDSEQGRVQWEVLFQPHVKMKSRLGFAQEVVKRIEALPYACPIPIQPHQLLLQDFGDIGTVHRLIQWLIEQDQDATHLDHIRQTREYLAVVEGADEDQGSKPLKREVSYLQQLYRPRRRWQFACGDDKTLEDEDAMIQRCLLEYGERVVAGAINDRDLQNNSNDEIIEHDGSQPSQRNFLAQLASQAAAVAATTHDPSSNLKRATSKHRMKKSNRRDPRAAEFDAQYQKLMKQAEIEQRELLKKQQEREVHLLQQVVPAPEQPSDTEVAKSVSSLNISTVSNTGQPTQSPLRTLTAQLRECEQTVERLIQEKRSLEAQTSEAHAQDAALSASLVQVQQEITKIDATEAENEATQPILATLRQLVTKNEQLKVQKNEFRDKCRKELGILHERVAYLKRQAEEDAANQDEETLRLNEIEQMHAQMGAKHKAMKLALGEQTRKVHLKMRQIDEVPTRIELVQYEKRFLELYEEVALTLDETRKYYCVYNTLKTTHEFLEKEISLINSIHENFDVAMSSKAATQAFFTQMDGIIQNVKGTVSKQQALQADHQGRVENLDSKYQLLLEKERTYVNAIREFQKECEKNEKLTAKLHQGTQMQRDEP